MISTAKTRVDVATVSIATVRPTALPRLMPLISSGVLPQAGRTFRSS